MRNQREHDLCPLRFIVLPKEKVWGGDRIAELLGRGIPADRPIGEVWVVWDQLRVENGIFAGKTLADLVCKNPLSILGSRLVSWVATPNTLTFVAWAIELANRRS
jgi:mannose-6-phosphate isomerase class I